MPKEDLNECDWRLSNQGVTKLLFQKNRIFDKINAEKIGWISRVNHYEMLIAKALIRDLQHLTSPQIGGKQDPNFKSLVPLIAFDFLRLLQVIGSPTVTKHFKKQMEHSALRIRKMFPDGSDESIAEMSLIMSILGRLKAIADIGMSVTLLEHCCSVALPFLNLSERRRLLNLSHAAQVQKLDRIKRELNHPSSADS